MSNKKILEAFDKEDYVKVKKLLSGKNVDWHTLDKQGNSLLMLAVIGKQIDLVSMCIDKVDVNHQNNSKTNALTYAAYDDMSNIASLLLSAGADVSLRDSLNYIPLYWAIIMQHESAALLLSDFKNEGEFLEMEKDFLEVTNKTYLNTKHQNFYQDYKKKLLLNINLNNRLENKQEIIKKTKL